MWGAFLFPATVHNGVFDEYDAISGLLPFVSPSYFSLFAKKERWAEAASGTMFSRPTEHELGTVVCTSEASVSPPQASDYSLPGYFRIQDKNLIRFVIFMYFSPSEESGHELGTSLLTTGLPDGLVYIDGKCSRIEALKHIPKSFWTNHQDITFLFSDGTDVRTLLSDD